LANCGQEVVLGIREAAWEIPRKLVVTASRRITAVNTLDDVVHPAPAEEPAGQDRDHRLLGVGTMW